MKNPSNGRKERYCNWHNDNPIQVQSLPSRAVLPRLAQISSSHVGLVQVLAELVTNVNNP
ncbi:hypothetical protein DL89DRAFT_269802 [Linderina pennispora]|uniref:Uncharacterized protein n=1 Tax=Linderina pennispora TaxID=61395 RepID=A0A1Y1W0V3_9FUNG|nr:uncharacterized protein DL89DRAFT_269802 [Linderina pennispora]ORX66754.1 hypothetical protein DL89DRAFT_269802 [Linderina pennispora]